jgi:hypothetical protein
MPWIRGFRTLHAPELSGTLAAAAGGAGFAVVANGDGGVIAIDARDLWAPRSVGSVAVDSFAAGVAAARSHAYVGVGTSLVVVAAPCDR